MTSNVPWNNQFEGNYPNSNENSTAWSRPLVNTPQTNPASWPQLGSSTTESEPSAAEPQVSEESNWSTTTMSNSATNREATANAWGRVSNENNPKTPSATGWGVPSSGPAWGQTTVDNGTAVWGKATTCQSQSGWSGQGQVSQNDEVVPSTSGWGVSNAISVNSTETNSQPTVQTSSLPTSTNQPVSWAKAASAGLPTANNSSDSSPPETEQETADTCSTPVSTSAPSVETDPVQKLVNSHEGWGKKPIQQGTSWNISDPGTGYSGVQSRVSNGTEAWGKHGSGQMQSASGQMQSGSGQMQSGSGQMQSGSGQMQSGSGWGENSNNKSGSGWGASPNYQPAAPSQGWSTPSQQQSGRPGYMSGNGPTNTSWGDQPQSAQAGVNNGRWNDMSNQGQGQASNSNWGTGPPLSQQPVTPSWGNTPGNSNSGSWGTQSASTSQGPGWGGNMPQQAPLIDHSSWTRPADGSRGVDNGTAAWGDPGTYTKVNLWDKRGKPTGNNEAVAGQMPPMNSQIKTTGWGAPNQPANRPPSPKGWGDVSPTRTNPVDNGTAGWGKPLSNEKWDKGNGASNWNSMKPTGAGWGQPPEPQWGADSGPTWGQNDGIMKNNMDYGSRGLMPPKPNLTQQQQLMLRGQTPSGMPPQAPNHLQQQIRHAVVNGIVPPEVLNPQLMSPQHMQNILQFISKAAEIQSLQSKISTILNQSKNIPNMVRSQQIEQYSRVLQQNQHQLELLRRAMIQSMLQKAQPNPASKMNNAMNTGMDLGRMRSGSANQPMMSPLNNMNPMMQALPSAGLSSVSSPTGREESRFINSWKQTNNFGSMGDNLLQPNPSNMGIGMGPGGDSAFNGGPYRPQLDDLALNESRLDGGVLQTPRDPSQPTVDTSSALADIGPPEFTPGVPWKGFRNIDPEADPNITPGSVAIAKTMSINTVRDADQVLNRDRAAQSDVSVTGSVSGNLANTAGPNISNDPGNVPQSWSTASADNTNWANQSQENRGSWLVLTNFNQQVDPSYVQSLCGQHGNVVSFQPHYPMEGMALVKYNSPGEAANAKKALNMCMVNSTMIVATVVTDKDVSNFMTAPSGGSWSSTPSSRFATSAPSNAYMSQPPLRDSVPAPSAAPPQQYWGANPTNNMTSGTTWAGAVPQGLAWSRSTGEETARVMSPMHSLLPENLLGGETM